MAARSVIFGCEGLTLTPEERGFFSRTTPWGFILFARNIDTPEQIKALTAELRAAVGHNAPILIDQEGGRVARLLPPHWTAWENALPFMDSLPNRATRLEAMQVRYHIIAQELLALGIDVNCAPMADIAQTTTHPAIAHRCYGRDATEVSAIARTVAQGLALGGVLPVLKHIPGHGRTPLDSHVNLPLVSTDRATLDAEDFAAFKALADLPMAMTAHIVYAAIDPDACATWSDKVVSLIRNDIGFQGLLMTDDLSMHALTGPFPERVTRAITAGCDVALHCNGKMHEMTAVAEAAPLLAGPALTRANAVDTARPVAQPVDIAASLQRIVALASEGENAG